MNKNETNETAVETEVEKQPEPTKETNETAVETEVEKQPEPTKELPEIVKELKEQYEGKIQALQDAYGKQIAERDTVIKQLLNNDNKAPVNGCIAFNINKKRNFKKW